MEIKKLLLAEATLTARLKLIKNEIKNVEKKAMEQMEINGIKSLVQGGVSFKIKNSYQFNEKNFLKTITEKERESLINDSLLNVKITEKVDLIKFKKEKLETYNKFIEPTQKIVLEVVTEGEENGK